MDVAWRWDWQMVVIEQSARDCNGCDHWH